MSENVNTEVNPAVEEEVKEVEVPCAEVTEAAPEAAEEETATIAESPYTEPGKTVDYEILTDEERAKKAKWKNFWDKITTGILIFLMASPFIILIYIFLWFIFK